MSEILQAFDVFARKLSQVSWELVNSSFFNEFLLHSTDFDRKCTTFDPKHYMIKIVWSFSKFQEIILSLRGTTSRTVTSIEKKIKNKDHAKVYFQDIAIFKRFYIVSIWIFFRYMSTWNSGCVNLRLRACQCETQDLSIRKHVTSCWQTSKFILWGPARSYFEVELASFYI